MATTPEAQDGDPTESARAHWPLGAPIALLALFFLNHWHPLLRFSDPMLNYGVAAIVLSSPWVAAAWAWTQPDRLLRARAVLLSLVAGALLALPLAWTILSMASLAASGGQNDGFAVIQEEQLLGTRIRVYQINPGGFSSYSYTVRQERDALGGLVMVRELCGDVPSEIRIRVLAPDRVAIDHPECPKPEVRVSQHVWL